MEAKPLSFGVLLGLLYQVIGQVKDPRLASNNTRYSLKDGVLGAFSVFFMHANHSWNTNARCRAAKGRITLKRCLD